MTDVSIMEAVNLRAGLEGLLDYYRHIGVDLALDDAPHDRFAESAALEQVQRDAVPDKARTVAALPRPHMPSREIAARPKTALAAGAGEIASSASAAAASAVTLEQLRANLDAFDGCALKTTATQLVFSDGNPLAKIMLIGEAPGADEDREGRPFVGRAGQLLDKMLAAIGLDRTQVYISNVVPWRPPGNRTPTPLEISACMPFTRRQIELVNPDILVCIGAPAMQALFETKEGILKMRGRWATMVVGDRNIPATAILHPAYLLRQPLQKRLAWRDMLALRHVIDGSVPKT